VHFANSCVGPCIYPRLSDARKKPVKSGTNQQGPLHREGREFETLTAHQPSLAAAREGCRAAASSAKAGRLPRATARQASQPRAAANASH
jgi:hypothetical protein